MKRGIGLVLALALLLSCFAAAADSEKDSEYLAGLAYMEQELYYSAYEAFNSSWESDADEMAEKCIRDWPKNGEVWRGENVKQGSMELTIKVNQDDDTAYFARLYKSGKLVCCLFIGGRGQATVKLPAGTYSIKVGTGRNWFGLQEAFGRYGHYEYMTFDDAGSEKVALKRDYSYTITVNVETVNPDADDIGAEYTSWEEFME